MNKYAVRFLNAAITFYQYLPFFPHYVCRYQPTCSQYMKEAIQVYGWYGIVLGMKRILRCHPWADGGHDPLPL